MVAEFFAIFAGIVLGLLADDWRQNRLDHAREGTVLAQILSDLEADSAELAAIDRRVQMWGKAGLWVAKNRGASVASDSAEAMIRPLFFITIYRPQRAAYSGLRDAGELALIRDEELRQNVINYFEVQQQYIETLYAAAGEYYSDILRSHGQYLVTTVPNDAESLRDRAQLALLDAWSNVSSDNQFSERLISLGSFGATVALRTPAAREANLGLRNAIEHYLK